MPPTDRQRAAATVATLGSAILEHFPPMFASEEDTITMAEILDQANEDLNECQAPLGSDDVCGLPENSRCHNPLNGGATYHAFVPIDFTEDNAGVAQSAEQDFRKVEAVGSTPIPSSIVHGLDEAQREIVAKIVHHRVAQDDNTKAVNEAKASLIKLDAEYKKSKETHEAVIAARTRQARFNLEQMLVAENELRESILQDVTVNGVPVTQLPAEEHEAEEIGRAD